MISLLGPFALKTAPFSWPRFALFMAGLAAIAAVSIAGERRMSAPVRGAVAHVGVDEATIVRFPQPIEDTFGDLRQIGLPWFLRREGATGRTDTLSDVEIDIAVSYEGKAVGKYVERLIPLGPDRTKLFVTFVPEDMSLVGQLAAPIETKLDPVSLMHVVMAEHLRSSINGGGFDMRVLTETPGSRWSVFRKALGDSGLCQNPQVDDFRPCSEEEGAANIRRAYREEAERGGPR